MINKILAWFNAEEESADSLDVKLAEAVLLVEVMMADNRVDDQEIQGIREVLAQEFSLSQREQDEVIEAAEQMVQESNDLYRFTECLNSHFDVERKFQFIVKLWRIAFADGDLDQYEDHMIRKINELLYLHHSHFMRAKHEAMEQS
ncbi:TerB family tellurite resistance protein [Gynuella sunshinyii]|uniref:Co-chaperone DjlA N-terminal domain-containing protein n=1 Tax=Gynuella sunshinyii YC6258 TaxID=1445510 RepID=A0A0C5VMG5_9GAMM|nr:TerB family tellurite resistance protein [Gynuella sunshinyii]AJQ95922.1 hypothetical protein YC6258_03886 [Gynuella sunshinyii YC6258]